jgi:hypothetical protein
MRINAYILAADPAWIESSVLSYYDLVKEIIVSYDENSLGWTGKPVQTEECLRRLKAIDKDSKMKYIPGDYAREEYFNDPMQNDTYQRQCAFRIAKENADWVFQMDTDEIVSDPSMLYSILLSVDKSEYQQLQYPSRWIYAKVNENLYLELSNRRYQVVATYLGSGAVRANASLFRCRSIERDEDICYITLNNFNSKYSIKPESAIFHFSWMRENEDLNLKFQAWSHSKDRDWTPDIKKRYWCVNHPYLATLISPFIMHRDNTFIKCIRLSKINKLSNLIYK